MQVIFIFLYEITIQYQSPWGEISILSMVPKILSIPNAKRTSTSSQLVYVKLAVRVVVEIVFRMHKSSSGTIWINSRHLFIVTIAIVSFRSHNHLCTCDGDATRKSIKEELLNHSKSNYIITRKVIAENIDYQVFFFFLLIIFQGWSD